MSYLQYDNEKKSASKQEHTYLDYDNSVNYDDDKYSLYQNYQEQIGLKDEKNDNSGHFEQKFQNIPNFVKKAQLKPNNYPNNNSKYIDQESQRASYGNFVEHNNQPYNNQNNIPQGNNQGNHFQQNIQGNNQLQELQESQESQQIYNSYNCPICKEFLISLFDTPSNTRKATCSNKHVWYITQNL